MSTLGDPDKVKITDKVMRAMAGVTMAGSALEKPRMVKTYWEKGQSFTAEEDPDRMNCLFKSKTGEDMRWSPPAFVGSVDPVARGLSTTVTELALPGQNVPMGAFARVVHGVFTPEECAELISSVNDKGFTPALLNVGGGMQRYEPEFRRGHRAIVDSAALTKWMFEVLRPHLDGTLPDGAELVDLNERCRVLCYTPGQFFAEHYDGCYTRSPHIDPVRGGDCSRVTLQVYLHDVPPSNGGATTFLDSVGNAAPVPYQPACGSVLMFTQDLLHEGSLVSRGIKYTMRTEAMYVSTYVRKMRPVAEAAEPAEPSTRAPGGSEPTGGEPTTPPRPTTWF